MLIRKFSIIVLSVFVLAAVGCRSNPVQNVSNAPIGSGAALKMEQIKNAIIRAGSTLGWRVKAETPGHLVATLDLRKHQAVVDITHDTKSYSIKYKDSTNLDYDGTNIHSNYNGWIKNLSVAIDNQIAAIQ